MKGELFWGRMKKIYLIENQQVIIETDINGERILDIGGGGMQQF